MDPRLQTLADPPNFAVLTTVLPDGAPQAHVMWFNAEDDHLLVNTEPQRQKYHNVQRDPRVTLTIWDRDNPYHYVEARGTVVAELRGDAARAHQDRLSLRYTGRPYDDGSIQTERVALVIEPSHVFQLALKIDLAQTARFTEA